MPLFFVGSVLLTFSLLRLAESIVAGGATGFLSGLLGVGGGFIMIPLLTLMGVPIHTAVGTTLAFIACASLSALLQHIRQGSIDPTVAVIMALPAIPAANVAARFVHILPPAILHLLFGFLLVGVFLMYHLAPMPQAGAARSTTSLTPTAWYVLQRQRPGRNELIEYGLHIPKALLCGLATGLFAGFFGSGGVFLVPLAVVVLRMPIQIISGTALAILIPAVLVGAVTHWRLGNVDVVLWLPLVLAGIVGGQLGARYVVRLPAVLLKRLFLLLVSTGALFMLVKGFTAVYGGWPSHLP